MKKEKIVKNWLAKAQEDLKTAKDLYKSKHYDWCLFIWHLVIEKALKAKIVSLDKELLFSHNLIRLAKLAEYPATKEEIAQLREITTYNIEARYDDYKASFYRKATKEYTTKWVKICENIYQSIKNSI